MNVSETTMGNKSKMAAVEIFADTTGQYTEDEINRCNVCRIEVPESILKDWFTSEVKPEYNTDLSYADWYKDVYTCHDTEGLYSFCKTQGFEPVCGKNCNGWCWH